MVYFTTMMKSSPSRFHLAPIVSTGLVAAYIVGSLQVYASNAHLLKTVTLLANAGYLTVPNRLIAPYLKSLATALMGGVFFALSIGAGVTLTAFLMALTWKTIGRRKKSLAVLLALPWIALTAGVNLKGVSVFPSLYFTLVPLLVAALTLRFTPDRLDRSAWIRMGLHGALVLILAAAWSTQAGSGMFITIRDRLLLSNPVGIGVNDFYYRYTLYPAEAFKSLHQKMLKTCRLHGFSDPVSKRKILRRLSAYNYLALGNGKTRSGAAAASASADNRAARASVDLTVSAGNDTLLLANGSRPVMEISSKEFLEKTAWVLKSFSEKCDRHLLFRQATFLSLLVGFPIVLYVGLQFLLAGFLSLFIKPGAAAVAAALLCLVAGTSMLIPVRSGMDGKITADRIPALLQSEKWQDRVAALKAIAGQKKNREFGTGMQTLTNDPHIPVRYWLARSLARTRGSRAHTALLELMGDPQPIVACQALYSLGRRRDKRAINAILYQISHSDHWYVQWYGYNALKALGWRQKISI
ncbi:MAG: HEAT repeat domain-containing protein [Deltaproteobacteria bacterium]|nr:HEAT repeat domain-containing protein [Deltaproteobacteria bacterium]